ncbi:MAG TPA: methionine--tRNA ligase [Candidatus Solibacter sp.]|nr:methionine--tRNA ligase [Candidatus Solibacter sp.]
MTDTPKYYVTTAIDYVNGVPHLGHAFEKIGADVLVRYKRMTGHDTWLVVGSDEHSQSVEKEAKAKGMTPAAYSDSMVPRFLAMFDRLQVGYSEFVRTSSEANRATTEEFLQRVYDNGYIYKGKFGGFFCPSCEQYYQERELVDGKCPVHLIPLEWVEEDNYFLRLSAFTEQLLELHRREDFLQPASRRNEMLNVIQEGLQDVSISRGFTTWGFPLPFDRSQVIYVWFDALLSYVTGVGFGTDKERFNRFWPCDVHVIGKGITRFHTIMWPAMLWAAGVELPRRVFAHGYVNVGGEKMSKSRGIFVEPLKLVDTLQPLDESARALAGSDGVRYCLLREVPFDRDGEFDLGVYVDRYNADLANDFGNLASRVLKMIGQYTGGEVPEPADLSGMHAELADAASALAPKLEKRMDDLDFSGALEDIWQVVGRANKYVEEAKPWELNKNEAARPELHAVLYNLAEVLRVLAYVAFPFVPDACESLARQLGVQPPSELGPGTRSLAEAATWGGLAAGHRTAAGEILFPRLDKGALLAAG